MDTHKNNMDNVSRLRDGKIDLQKNFPYGAKQTSKAEDFEALKLRIAASVQNGEKVDDRTMECFFNDITGKSTTSQELHLASGLTHQLAQHPEVLSEKGQSLLMDAVSNLAKHRNSDYSMVRESRETFSEISKHLSQLTGEAQRKFFDNVNSSTSDQDQELNFQITTNIAHANENGIDDIRETAQDAYIHLFGRTAQNMLSLSTEKQAQFQQAAVALMQKTQFPIKFDADSFREALFVVPENVRTAAYNAQLVEFEAKFSSADTAEVNEASSVVPEVVPEYGSPSNETVGTPVEVLPQALPVAPEALQAAKRDEQYYAQEELEENLATTQAE
ncbi:MAG: hypothetical protein LBB05_02385 [Puniceicoccales bacterium]|jgi:hypothetical protein|nr:hypothetical protein [Puniceicoccales bacterium]